MVHVPAVEAIAGEFIHDGIFAMAGHIEIEYPGCDRRAMDEEQHRPRRPPRFWRAEPLAIHPQRDIALLCPVFAAPDFTLQACWARALRRHCTRQRSGNEAKARALDDGAPRPSKMAVVHAPT